MFYTYRIDDEEGPLYVGKGSGRRYKTSARKFGFPAEIVERFDKEADAYAAERRLIAELTPRANRHPGGNGCRAQVVKYRPTRDERLMARIGTRTYAARLLLEVHKVAPHLIEPSKIEHIREVARGCGA